MGNITKRIQLGLLLLIASLMLVSGSSNIDYSYPSDAWIDRVLSLNQSGSDMVIDNITVTGWLNVTGASSIFAGSFPSESAIGVDSVRIGNYISPRIIFEDGNNIWEIDHLFSGGVSAFRIFTPLRSQVTFTNGNTVFNGNITVNDNLTADNIYGNVTGAITNTNAPAQCPTNTGIIYYNGSDSICTQAIGYWTSDSAGITPANSSHNVTVNNLFVNNSIYIGDSDDTSTIFFYDNLSETGPTGEWLMWNDTVSNFQFSDSLRLVNGHMEVDAFLQVGWDIFTTGTNDDLWLGKGITYQEDSDFKAYANGKLNITGPSINDGYMTIGEYTLFGNITRGFDSLIIDDGDVVIGNRLFTENMVMAFAPPYGPAIMAHAYDSALSIISLGYTADLDADTQYICDSTNPFLASHKMSMLTVIYSDPSYTDATGMITDIVNSTCIKISFGSANGDEIVSATDMTYYVYPHPVFAALDNGDLHFKIGESPDARMHIWTPNGTGFHNVYIDDVAGADQHQSLTIDTDIKNKTGIVGFNSLMYSSTGVSTPTQAENINLEWDATNINLSTLAFMSTSIIGTPGKNTHIDGILMDAGVTDIIHMGSEDILARVYDNGLDITNVVTGNLHTVFNADNDVLYMGDTVNFTIMTFSFDTSSSANLVFNYYYCNETGGYNTLNSIVDTTNGFAVSGTISFTNPSDRGVCNQQLNGTPFADTTNLTYIALERTKNFVVTPPTLDDITISGATTHFILREDLMKLNPVNEAPEDCDATMLGAIYFDISEDDMCQCKSTGWKEITGGGACT